MKGQVRKTMFKAAATILQESVFLRVFLFLCCSVAPCSGVEQFPKGFHNGGIGSCDGCHSRASKMSASSTIKTSGSKSPDTAVAQASDASDANRGMFNGQDPGSTCLICHTAPQGQRQPLGYFVATSNEDLASGYPPAQMTPGGDFSWLKKTYRWATREGGAIKDGLSQGDHHGHNIVAAQFGYGPDFTNITAPGGTYPSDKFTCTSCHDPHAAYRRLSDGSVSTDGSIPVIASGSYKNSPAPDATRAVGTYRLLAGKGYSPRITGSSVVFTADPPVAVSPDKYNRAESNQADTRVAYGSDMSEWCQNCHAPHSHPTGNSARMSPLVAKQYNAYIASGNMSGSKSTSYSSLVPFETGTKDYQELKKIAGGGDSMDMSGPKSNENIMCLTCHRAHAGGWDAMTRWNSKTDLIVYDGKYPGTDNGVPPYVAQGRTSTETKKAYYDRPVSSFAVFQRGLCSKCHAKD